MNIPRKEDAYDLLMRALGTGSSSGAIRGQEADGQQSFVNSEILPTKMSNDAQRVLEAAGVKFLAVIENDPIFQYVKLPKGWQKIATDHSMHSDLVDDKGRKRASIFYKAASYDRRASLNVNRLYEIRYDYDHADSKDEALSHVVDGDKVLFSTKPISYKEDEKRDAQDSANQLANEWLTKHYPKWEDAGAYWD